MEVNFIMKELGFKSRLIVVVIAYVAWSMLLEAEIIAFLSKLILLGEKSVSKSNYQAAISARGMRRCILARTLVTSAIDQIDIFFKESRKDQCERRMENLLAFDVWCQKMFATSSYRHVNHDSKGLEFVTEEIIEEENR
ncbi:hypothetical protein Tco_0771333 [Tanacetum coccineum]|uniref:Uncharacterized protein n=1 Tax=Tanacetum coccineum TaxID=301880 RepID=A0ABQ4ZFS9_9ASTR